MKNFLILKLNYINNRHSEGGTTVESRKFQT